VQPVADSTTAVQPPPNAVRLFLFTASAEQGLNNNILFYNFLFYSSFFIFPNCWRGLVVRDNYFFRFITLAPARF
jgi:hypothetical protein